jgi:hypothetical protein
MSFDRLLQASNELCADLGIVEPRDKSKEITVLDAQRYIAKSLRELRHGIALGGEVDAGAIAALADKMAAHLGVTDLATIKASLKAEADVFTAEFIDGVEKLGQHAHFHEDHGVMDLRTFPEETNRAPPPSGFLHRATFAAPHVQPREKRPQPSHEAPKAHAAGGKKK